MSSPYVDRITVSAQAVVRSPEGCILLLSRKKPPYVGYWTVPGGKVEVGEHPADTAVRELFEETGIRATVVRWCGTASEVVRDEDGTSHFLLYVYELAWQSGDVVESSEGALRWFAEAEFDDESHPIALSDRWFLRELVLAADGPPKYVAMDCTLQDGGEQVTIRHFYP